MDAIRRIMMLSGLLLLSASACAGESAHLTIGGVVPPRQRVALVQPQAQGDPSAMAVLKEESNCGLGYTVTVEAKTATGQAKVAKQTHFRCGSSANRNKRSATAASLLKLQPVAGTDTFLITVASQ